jgi:hypothetical protein
MMALLLAAILAQPLLAQLDREAISPPCSDDAIAEFGAALAENRILPRYQALAAELSTEAGIARIDGIALESLLLRNEWQRDWMPQFPACTLINEASDLIARLLNELSLSTAFLALVVRGVDAELLLEETTYNISTIPLLDAEMAEIFVIVEQAMAARQEREAAE